MRKIITLLIIVSSIYLCQTIIFADKKKIELDKAQIEVLKTLEKQGFLVLEPDLYTAYIHPDVWAQLNIMRKKDFSAGIAIYCGNDRGDYEYYVTIYDLMSGKKLAKYSTWGGFKVY